jgi:hypothetical protein
MSFEPDILVTTPEGVSLVIEAKVKIPDVRRAEDQLKDYMVAMQCPVGALVTPDRMFLYSDSYTGRTPSSVKRVGEFSVKELWHQPPPKNPVLFENFVQHWLEYLVKQPHPELPTEFRLAVQEYIEPAIAAGELRAAHPRSS